MLQISRGSPLLKKVKLKIKTTNEERSVKATIIIHNACSPHEMIALIFSSRALSSRMRETLAPLRTVKLHHPVGFPERPVPQFSAALFILFHVFIGWFPLAGSNGNFSNSNKLT